MSATPAGLLADALSALPQPVALTDLEGRVLWRNAAADDLLGRAARLALAGPAGEPAPWSEALRFEAFLHAGRGGEAARIASVQAVRLPGPPPGFVCALRPLPGAIIAPGAPSPLHDEERAPAVLAALGEALIGQLGGELLVREASTLGRIYVQRGRIAWAHLSTEPERFTELLVREGVDAGELRAVLDECRASGRNVGETIIDWGLVPRERLRELLRAHTAVRVRAILALRRPAVLFAPLTRAYGSTLTFALRELLDGGPP